MTKLLEEVYIIGAGGHGKVVVRAAQLRGHRVVAVFDDDPARIGQTLCGVPIVSTICSLRSHPPRPALIAIGNNARRMELAATLDLPWLTLLHLSSIVDSSAKIGWGAVVFAGAVVQVDAIVGDHAIVNDNATVEHDCVVGAGAHVSCNACLTGEVRVGNGALIGAGAVVLPRIEIGDFAIVGAGAVVTADVPAHATVVGNPARLLRSSQKQLRVTSSKIGKECHGAI